MPKLSNPSSAPNGDAAPSAGVVIRTAHATEIDACVPFLLSNNHVPAPEALVRQFREFAAVRALRLDRLIVAQIGDRIVWYVLPIPNPGRTTMFMLPGAPPADDAVAAADLVIAAASEASRADGIHLAQVLLDPSDNSNRALLVRHGFADLAELIYLQANLYRPIPMPDLPEGFSLHRYSPMTHALFAEAIVQTYRDSLDCPGLAGLRGIDDIILGHQASGEFDPNTWFVLAEKESPAGVLLLSSVTGHDATELVYIGLAAPARRRGLGRWLVLLAEHITQSKGNRRLTLAVDSKNMPALKLYYTHGFARIAAKLAMIKDLRIGRQGG